MVADTSGAVQRAYGVPSVMPGVDIAARVTFLVGPDGKIARVWPKVDPVVNAKEVLDAVAALGGKHALAIRQRFGSFSAGAASTAQSASMNCARQPSPRRRSTSFDFAGMNAQRTPNLAKSGW